ncbi:MAG TPA: ATP-binding protein [Opitutaceae bacterium]|jgi:serine/threonine-protein kinase RsbW|nr:ATP-binding protein [Opitutaceae bacterium]
MNPPEGDPPAKSIVLPGALESLGPLADFVHAAARETGLDQKAAYRLHLAVDEVATNVITHAYAEKGVQGSIHLHAQVDPDALRIHLEDTGEPYDPTVQSDPEDINLPLEERGVGGLGIFLAKRNVDGFHYERRGDRNRVTFVVKRPPGQA